MARSNTANLKPIYWCGSSKRDLDDFPEDAKDDAGYQLHRVQQGKEPTKFDALPQLGRGAMEIKVYEDTDTYRVIYVAKFEEAVYVLHCFKKKSKKGRGIPQEMETVIRMRYKEVVRNRPAI